MFFLFSSAGAGVGSENGWANVSEECFFSVFDETADMRAGHMLYVHTHLLKSTAYKHTDKSLWLRVRGVICVYVSGL